MDLRSYLAREGLTQQGFADRIGVTQGLVWQWLSGKTRITLAWALKVESITGGAVSVRDWPTKEETAA